MEMVVVVMMVMMKEKKRNDDEREGESKQRIFKEWVSGRIGFRVEWLVMWLVNSVDVAVMAGGIFEYRLAINSYLSTHDTIK